MSEVGFLAEIEIGGSYNAMQIEIVSKIIQRHSDLSTTQKYLGKVNGSEAIRWIELLHG